MDFESSPNISCNCSGIIFPGEKVDAVNSNNAGISLNVSFFDMCVKTWAFLLLLMSLLTSADCLMASRLFFIFEIKFVQSSMSLFSFSFACFVYWSIDQESTSNALMTKAKCWVSML